MNLEPDESPAEIVSCPWTRWLTVVLLLVAAHPMELLWSRRWNVVGGVEAFQALVLPAFLWVCWCRRAHFALIWQRFPLADGTGMWLIVTGAVGWLINHIWRVELLGLASVWMIAAGTVRAACGLPVWREVKGVAVILLLLLPMPSSIRDDVNAQMQYRMAQATSACLQGLGQDARRDVVSVRIGEKYLSVRPSQSGLGAAMVGITAAVALSVWAGAGAVPTLLLSVGGAVFGLAVTLFRLVSGGLMMNPAPAISEAVLLASAWWCVPFVILCVWIQAKKLGVSKAWTDPVA